ncbi:MAG TPA: phosphate ABC transporter substrate-binding protein, partial [Anaerolineae bacterium]|nr:phosphate ABC transporter substrate-binding protein [Anaerolineae bacterium]
IGVMGDPGILDAVAKDPLGIGYNNLGYAFDNVTGTSVPGTVVLPIDKNNNGKADTDETIETKQQAVSAVAAGKYPSPPARPLNLVTKGKPTSLTQVFIAWVLSDGQKFVDGAGFVPLAASEINSAQAKIK